MRFRLRLALDHEECSATVLPPKPREKATPGASKPGDAADDDTDALPQGPPPKDHCYRCHLGTWRPGNEMLLCDGAKCGRAYHLQCLRPAALLFLPAALGIAAHGGLVYRSTKKRSSFSRISSACFRTPATSWFLSAASMLQRRRRIAEAEA